MILTDDEALAIVKNNSEAVPSWVTKAREDSKELFALIEGEDFTDLLITKIEHIESEQKKEARKKYSRNIVDLYERLFLPIANVFSSSGGSKKYFTESLPKEQAEQFFKTISNLQDGKSLEKYIEERWMPLYHTDPNGVIFMEYTTNNEEKVWPTYKSIENIRQYMPKGNLTEYIVFEPKEFNDSEKKIWRIVDDKMDRFILQDGESFSITKASFEHPFGEVPAVINSNIIDVKSKLRISPVNKVVELSKEYARDQSIKTLYKFLHGFPIHWRYVTQCKQCQGTGKNGANSCTDCTGKGYYQKKDVTDIVTLPVPKKEDQKVAPEIAGYINPSLETWTQYNNELVGFEVLIQDTHWGTHIERAANETATGRFIDVQPVKNKLDKYSDSAEYVEEKLTEWIGNFVFPLKDKDTQVAQIGYGRRFIIDSPDTLLEKYNIAKTAGESTSVLDRMFNEYITSKYKNDPEWLRIELFKSRIEPYLHIPFKDIQTAFGAKEAARKAYFKTWWDDNHETLGGTDKKKVFDSKKAREQFDKDFEAVNKIETVKPLNPNPNGI